MNTHIPQLNTSTDAYFDLKPGRVRWCVFNLIAEYAGTHGLTHDDIERLYMRGVARDRYRLASDSGIRSRTAELVQSGLVERVPDKLGRSRTGRKTALWRLTPTAQVIDALDSDGVPQQRDTPTSATDPVPLSPGGADQAPTTRTTDSRPGGDQFSSQDRATTKPAHYCDGQQELFDALGTTDPVDNSR